MKAGQVPSLNRLPFSRVPPHKAIFFNEPKLADLKQALVKAGFQAEFNKGALIVNDLVAIKKVGSCANIIIALSFQGIIDTNRNGNSANFFLYVCNGKKN